MDTMDSESAPKPASLSNRQNRIQLSRPHQPHQAPFLLATPALEDFRWERDFERIYYRPEISKGRPKRYSGKRYVGEGWPPLTEIESNAGKGNCLDGTIKQWDTIVREAKAANKVPKELKEAHYYYLGCVIDDEKAKENSDEMWVFIEEDEGVRALEESKATSLPLEAYAKARRSKNRKRAASWMKQKTSSHSKSPRQILSVNPLLAGHNSANLDSGNSVMHKDGFRTAKLSFPSTVPDQGLGQDYTYMTRAAEETKNDYEYVKGIGKVSVNQQILKETEHVENQSSEQSPGSYALQDISFPLDQFYMAGLCVAKLDTDSSGIEQKKNNSVALFLKWQGKLDQTIRVFNGPEILCIPFKDVSAIFHNMASRKILFQDRRQILNIPGHPLGYLIELSRMPAQTLQILRSCCYALTKEPARQCDQRPLEFFQEKIKGFIKHSKKQHSTPQHPNLGQAMNSKENALKNFDHGSLERMRLNTTPTKGSRPAAQARKSMNPGKRNFTPSPTSPIKVKRRKPTIEQNRTISLASPKSIGPKKTIPDHKITMKGPNPEGLYYVSTLETKNILAVGLNDLVVRRVSEKEREKVGKRDRFDLFDGPWRIVKFDIPEKTYGMDSEDREFEAYGNGSQSKPPFEKVDAEQMGKTKVKLNFPSGSCVSPWIELSRLLPVLDAKNMYTGEIHASNLTVADHEVFKKLQQGLITRNAQNAQYEDGSTQISDTELEPTTSSDPVIDPVLFVEIKKGIFVAVIEVASQGLEDSDRYEVEKLRKKRLRLYDKGSAIVKEFSLENDVNDPWVKRLIQERPELTANKVVVAEYKVHWAGWPNEDDTWTLGTGNIPEDFMVEYHVLTDPLRDTPLDIPSAHPENLVCPDDLGKQKKKATSKAKSSTESKKKESNRSKKSEQQVGEVYNEKIRENQKEKDKAEDEGSDVEMTGGGACNIKTATLRSLDNSQAMGNKGRDRTKFQKQMGAAVQKLHAEQKGKAFLKDLPQHLKADTQNDSAPMEGVTDDTSMADDKDKINEANMVVEDGEIEGI